MFGVYLIIYEIYAIGTERPQLKTNYWDLWYNRLTACTKCYLIQHFVHVQLFAVNFIQFYFFSVYPFGRFSACIDCHSLE